VYTFKIVQVLSQSGSSAVIHVYNGEAMMASFTAFLSWSLEKSLHQKAKRKYRKKKKKRWEKNMNMVVP